MKKGWQVPVGYSIRKCFCLLNKQGKIVFTLWDKINQRKIDEAIVRLGIRARKSPKAAKKD